MEGNGGISQLQHLPQKQQLFDIHDVIGVLLHLVKDFQNVPKLLHYQKTVINSMRTKLLKNFSVITSIACKHFCSWT